MSLIRYALSLAAASTLVFACVSEKPAPAPDPLEKCKDYCKGLADQCSGEVSVLPENATKSAVKMDIRQTPPKPEACLAMCEQMPVGKPGDTGDTLECRMGVLSLLAESKGTGASVEFDKKFLRTDGDTAATVGTRHAHACMEAGFFSQRCGNNVCKTFCRMAASECTGNLSPFANEMECLDACKSFPRAIPKDFSVYVEPGFADTSSAPQGQSAGADAGASEAGPRDSSPGFRTREDSFSCRAYHLMVASTNASEAGVHCGHISAKVKGPCNNPLQPERN
jgi:hypothetical protein